MRTKGRIAIAIVVVLAGVSIYPQTPTARSGLHIADLMSASEFRAAGLNKLSSDELVELDSWLNSYLLRVVARVSQPSKLETASVIETQIDGEFHGWDGETIFKLANGQIWQQAEYDYEYEYDYRPDVMIYKSGSGYKMQVKGMTKTVAVKRIT